MRAPPALITFQETALNLPGLAVPLRGEETMMGADKMTKARSLVFIPVVGIPSALSVHGKDAVIPAGAVLTAYVTENTKITPGTVAQMK
jgi:hypothetical protein